MKVHSAIGLTRKAVELGLREIGHAPDMRQGRRLRNNVQLRGISPGGPKVLFISPRDWASHVNWEAVLGHALTLRGADVGFATCGGGLPLCDRVNTYEAPPVPCHTCSKYTFNTLRAYGYEPSSLAAHGWEAGVPEWPELDELSFDDLTQITYKGINIGQHLLVPLQWHLCNSNLQADPLAGVTMKRFLRSSRVIVDACRSLFDDQAPEVVVMLNGLFLFEALACAVAEQKGIRVVTYERGFIHGTLFFCHEPNAPRYEVSHSWPQYRDVALNPAQNAQLDEYIEDRKYGRRALFQYWPKPQFDATDEIAPARKVVVFTNVTWDSAVTTTPSFYPSFREWLADVLRLAAEMPDTSFVVRIHPAEVRVSGWQTREAAADVLSQLLPDLPDNVVVIGPEEQVSSYTLIEECDVGLTFSSTIGLELALLGTPVITAARPHYTGKGFTLDAESPEELESLLRKVLSDPSVYRPASEIARRYAYLLFFRAGLEQPPVSEPIPGIARLDVTDPDRLMPGMHKGVDAICDGILHGSTFVNADG